jgi:16S rRNA (guanine966-N2)-methyltransferase
MSANEVRIIGGAWRSRRLRFPARAGLRPTPDRVRETLFNWLGQDLTGWSCLDLFAGSGALGFEAASRGAARVVLVERDRIACEALIANARALGARQVEVVRADALEFVRAERGRYDLILLDPPYTTDPLAALVPLLPALLARDGRVYHESGYARQWPAEWHLHRQGRAGQVHFQLLTRVQDEKHGGLPGHFRSDHARS